jgi:hypothetical protein
MFSKYNKQIVSVCYKNIYKFNKNPINGSIYLSSVLILKRFKSFSKKEFITLKMTSNKENFDTKMTLILLLNC